MKRGSIIKLTVTALCAAINIIGAYIALVLRLPVYLDSIGTILNSALLGPFFGMATACLSSIISGVTSDIYAIYFMPDGIVTGLIAGLLFRTGWFKKWKLPLGVLILAVPGTIISACISAFLFKGVTSSGSSMIVQVLHNMGLNLVFSAFIVQILTDYLDRLISAAAVCLLTSRLDSRIKGLLKRENKPHGTL